MLYQLGCMDLEAQHDGLVGFEFARQVIYDNILVGKPNGMNPTSSSQVRLTISDSNRVVLRRPLMAMQTFFKGLL